MIKRPQVTLNTHIMEVIGGDHDYILLQTEYFNRRRAFDVCSSAQLSVSVTSECEYFAFDGQDHRVSLSATGVCYNLEKKINE